MLNRETSARVLAFSRSVSTAAKMAGHIHRVTMFKIPETEGQKKLLEAYKILAKDQKKDGKPYILSLDAGPTVDDPRSQGYTVVSKTVFASLDDMKYYDNECGAHAALKASRKDFGVQGPPLTVYFEAGVTASL